MRLIVCFAIWLCSAAAAFGQIDSSALRAKYGSPQRETFTVRPGIEMTVTYGQINMACQLEIPAGVATEQQEDAILEDVVPASVRGKELGKMSQMMGQAGAYTTEYEYVNITHPIIGGKMDIRPAVFATFKDSYCQNVPPPHF